MSKPQFYILDLFISRATSPIARGKHKTVMINKEKTAELCEENVQIFIRIIQLFSIFYNHATNPAEYKFK